MRRLRALPAVLGLALLAPGTAAAQDSMAPDGALPHWLPTKQWVYEHWLPFDERRLYRVLGVDRGAVWRHLRDDAAHDLAQLGRRRGLDPDELAAKLVAPRRADVSARTLRTLRARARRVVTQGHLSQHIVFHSLHQRTIPLAAPRLFGTGTVEEYLQLRRAELSPLQIARQHGRTRGQVQRAVERALRATARRGVRTGAISAAQARLLLDRQLRQVPRWLDQSRYNGPPQTGAGSVPLLPQADYASHPSITADGRLVAFDAYRAKIPEAKRQGEISVVGYDVALGRRVPLSHPVLQADDAPLRPRSNYNGALSADGSTVVYEQAEGNLNFAKRYSEMQVLARATPAVRAALRVSHPGGVRARASRTAYNPSVSADGRLVAFEATDDRGGSAPSRNGVWVRDLAAQTETLVGRGSGGAVYEPRIVGDGRSLVFTAGDAAASGHTLVYRRELAPGGATTLVSRADGPQGAPADRDAGQPAPSQDGTVVAFASAAPALGAATGRARVFVRDLVAGTTTAISPREGFAFDPAVSADGRFVAYALKASGQARRSTIRLHDRVAGTTVEVAGDEAAYAAEPAVSADGTKVVYTSTAGRRTPRKPGGLPGVFLRDVPGRTTTLLSTHAPLKARAARAGASTAPVTGLFLCPLAP